MSTDKSIITQLDNYATTNVSSLVYEVLTKRGTASFVGRRALLPTKCEDYRYRMYQKITPYAFLPKFL